MFFDESLLYTFSVLFWRFNSSVIWWRFESGYRRFGRPWRFNHVGPWILGTFIRNLRYSVLIDKRHSPEDLNLRLYRCENITSRRCALSLCSESPPSATKTPDLKPHFCPMISSDTLLIIISTRPDNRFCLTVLVKWPFSTLTQFTVPYPGLSKKWGSVMRLATSEFRPTNSPSVSAFLSHIISFATYSTTKPLVMRI